MIHRLLLGWWLEGRRLRRGRWWLLPTDLRLLRRRLGRSGRLEGFLLRRLRCQELVDVATDALGNVTPPPERAHQVERSLSIVVLANVTAEVNQQMILLLAGQEWSIDKIAILLHVGDRRCRWIREWFRRRRGLWSTCNRRD